ncbi:MAG: hypothetical protein JNL17_16045 [Cyclobacteriaceae bacterium]|nr:hypothetical protein [Cyclobacteriaceae bacterium]
MSEYDTIDRRILYSKQSCSGSGIEIVPMTVLEYAYDSKWIIAKSGDGQTNSKIQFWIIKNDYEAEPTVEVVKSNVLGPLDFESFSHELVSRKIELNLKKID